MINFLYLFKFLECGHFCINYVLKREKIKRRVRYNKVMMSLGLVKRVLKEYFYEVGCYEVSHLDNIDFSFITLLRYGKKFFHYVVVIKCTSEKVYFYDPLFLHIRKVKNEWFLKRWSHYCCIYKKKSNC